MTYFTRIDDYRTYSNAKSDFHFDYNANSGGGQAFLGGSFYDAGGAPHKLKELEGKYAHISFAYRDKDGVTHTVDLGADPETSYPISPRAVGNSQMKLGLSGKIRPSLVVPALLMLPATCGVNMAESLDVLPLTQNNYWLRSMWLECSERNGYVVLTPKDYVFSGCSSKKGSSNNKVIGETKFFLLDFNQRANDIIWAAAHSAFLPLSIGKPLEQISAVLTSNTPFNYEKCAQYTAEIMRSLSQEQPELYSGYSDPLLAIIKILQETESKTVKPLNDIDTPRNWIFFGAPGTGKSHELNRIAEESFSEENISRVTFYPDYTYSQFVGCFKPIAEKTVDENGETVSHITYRYVLGPFLKTYVEARKHPDQNYLLIVEEINRANPAAVFGDIFQLLDRRDDGCSEYSIATPEEMSNQLKEVFKDESTEADKLAIPSNMYIWATMNSADQGVFPMDTAFKRRWDFRYMGIDEGEKKIVKVKNGDVEEKKHLDEINIPCGKHVINWNGFRKAINNFMMSDNLKVNEDKLLGPFFVSPPALNEKRFADVFKDKVILYLYEDACKTKHQKMFRSELKTYAQICDAFNKIDAGIFADGFDASDIYITDEDDDQIIDDDDNQSEAVE